MPYSTASSAACTARGLPVMGHEITSWSFSTTSPSEFPQRWAVRKYGVRLMFSVPPATATRASSSRSEREASVIAASEEQHARSVV